jgi:hypothetical protein
MCAPFLRRLADLHGLENVLKLLLAALLLATVQAFALPPVRSEEGLDRQLRSSPLTSDVSE